MNRSMVEMKKAVRPGTGTCCGTTPAWRTAGKNPLQIDSAKPNEDYQAFLQGEVRYASLTMKNPDHAKACTRPRSTMPSIVMRACSSAAALEPKEGAAK